MIFPPFRHARRLDAPQAAEPLHLPDVNLRLHLDVVYQATCLLLFLIVLFDDFRPIARLFGRSEEHTSELQSQR